jgi:tRNA(Ile)-lysidine synthase
VLGAADIDRPLLATPKHELYAYALAHNLEWVEDETNHSDVYLRNRLRQKMHALSPSNKARLADLRSTQLKLEKEITAEVKKLAHTWGCRRYPYIMIQQPEALELLRFLANAKLTRPQMHAAWLAIKTAKPHTKHQCGSGVNLQVSFDKFELTVV